MLCCLILSSLGLSANAVWDLKSGESFPYPESWEMPDGTGLVIDFQLNSGTIFRYCFDNRDNVAINQTTSGSSFVNGSFKLYFSGDKSFTGFVLSGDNVTQVLHYNVKSGQFIGPVTNVAKIRISDPELNGFADSSKTPFYLCSLPDKNTSLLQNISNSLKDFFNTLWEWLQGIWDSIKEIPDKIGSFISALGDRIQGFFSELKESIKGFFIKLVDDIKGLFIPSDEFMTDYTNKWQTWFNEHFGAIAQTSEVLEQAFTKIKNFSPDSNPSITLPNIDVPVNGHTYHLIDSVTFTFDFLNNAPWSTFYSIYKSLVWVIFFFALFKLSESTYERIVNK